MSRSPSPRRKRRSRSRSVSNSYSSKSRSPGYAKRKPKLPELIKKKDIGSPEYRHARSKSPTFDKKPNIQIKRSLSRSPKRKEEFARSFDKDSHDFDNKNIPKSISIIKTEPKKEVDEVRTIGVVTGISRAQDEWIPETFPDGGGKEHIGAPVHDRDGHTPTHDEYDDIIRQVRDQQSPDLYGDSKPPEYQSVLKEIPGAQFETNRPYGRDLPPERPNTTRQMSFEQPWGWGEQSREHERGWDRKPHSPRSFNRGRSRSPRYSNRGRSRSPKYSDRHGSRSPRFSGRRSRSPRYMKTGQSRSPRYAERDSWSPRHPDRGRSRSPKIPVRGHSRSPKFTDRSRSPERRIISVTKKENPATSKALYEGPKDFRNDRRTENFADRPQYGSGMDHDIRFSEKADHDPRGLRQGPRDSRENYKNEFREQRRDSYGKERNEYDSDLLRRNDPSSQRNDFDSGIGREKTEPEYTRDFKRDEAMMRRDDYEKGFRRDSPRRERMSFDNDLKRDESSLNKSAYNTRSFSSDEPDYSRTDYDRSLRKDESEIDRRDNGTRYSRGDEYIKEKSEHDRMRRDESRMDRSDYDTKYWRKTVRGMESEEGKYMSDRLALKEPQRRESLERFQDSRDEYDRRGREDFSEREITMKKEIYPQEVGYQRKAEKDERDKKAIEEYMLKSKRPGKNEYEESERRSNEINRTSTRSSSIGKNNSRSPEPTRKPSLPESKEEEPAPDIFQLETKDEKTKLESRMKLFETYVPRAVKMKQHSMEKDHNPESLPPVKGRNQDPDVKDKNNFRDEDRSIKLLSKEEVSKRMSTKGKPYEEEQMVYRSIQIKGRDIKMYPEENKHRDGRGDEPRYAEHQSPYSEKSSRLRREGSPYSRSSRQDDRGDYRRESDRRSRDFSEGRTDRRRSQTGQNKDKEEYRKNAAPEVQQKYRDTDDGFNGRNEDTTYRSIEIRPKPVKKSESRYESEYPNRQRDQSPESYLADRRDQRRDSKSPRYKPQWASPSRQSRDGQARNKSVSRSPDRKVYTSETKDSKSGYTYYQESKIQEMNKKRERSWSRSPVREISITKQSAKKQPNFSRSRSRSTERSLSISKRSKEKSGPKQAYRRSGSQSGSPTLRSRSPEQWKRTIGHPKEEKVTSARIIKSDSMKKSKARRSRDRERTEDVPVPAIPSRWDSPEPKKNRWEETKPKPELNMPLILNQTQEIANMLKIQSLPESPPPHRKMKPHEKKAMEQKWSQLMSPDAAEVQSALRQEAVSDKKGTGSDKKGKAKDDEEENDKNNINSDTKVTSNDNTENMGKDNKAIELNEADKTKKWQKSVKRRLRSKWDSDNSDSDASSHKSRSRSRESSKLDDKKVNKSAEVFDSKTQDDKKVESSVRIDSKENRDKRGERSSDRKYDRSSRSRDRSREKLKAHSKERRSRDYSRERSKDRSRGRRSRSRSRDRRSRDRSRSQDRSRDRSRGRRSRDRSRDRRSRSRDQRSRDHSRSRYRKDSGKREKSPKVFWFHREAFEDQKWATKKGRSRGRGSAKFGSSYFGSSKKRSKSRSRSHSPNPFRRKSTSKIKRSPTPEYTRAGAVSIEELKKKYSKRSKSSDSSSSDVSPKKKKKDLAKKDSLKEEVKDKSPEKLTSKRKESLDDLESFLGDLKKEKKKQWIAEGKVKTQEN